jgi:hypothetical protein
MASETVSSQHGAQRDQCKMKSAKCKMTNEIKRRRSEEFHSPCKMKRVRYNGNENNDFEGAVIIVK